DDAAIAVYLELDAPVLWRVIPGEGDRRPQRAAPVEHLGLLQVEGVLALDAARAYVVADRVADHLEPAVADHRQLGLRHVPARVRADGHRLARAPDPIGRGLEEKLRPLRRVDAVVRVGAHGLVRARVEAAPVRDP